MSRVKVLNQKLIISIILIITMFFSIISPVLASAENISDTMYSIFTIEYIDENGKATYMLSPTKVEITQGMNAIDALNIAYKDKGEVLYKNLEITVIPKDGQAIGEVDFGKKAWWPFINNKKAGIKYANFKNNDVFRLIYTQNSSVGFPSYISPAGENEQGKISVNKNELITNMSNITQEQINQHQDEYNEILDIALDFEASQHQVNKAVEKLQTILKSDIIATDLQINSDKVELNIGENQQMIAKLFPEDSTDKVIWSSDNNQIAQVTEDGLVYAMAEGEALITAQANEKIKDTVIVKVVGIPAQSISLNKYMINLKEGTSERLLATVTPNNTTDTINWISNDENIAYVDESGLVVAKGEGSTIITAIIGNQKVICEVNVVKRQISDKQTVIFKHNNGQITELDNNNTINLSMIDEGRFEIENSNEEFTPYWDCKETIQGDESFVIHISSSGKLYPHIGKREARVYDKNPNLWDDAKLISTFNLNITPSDIVDLKAYLDGKVISTNNMIYLNGTESNQITVKGRLKDTDLYINIPNHALNLYASKNGVIYKDNEKNIIHFSSQTDDINTYTISMIENPDIKFEFRATSKKIDVVGMEVKYPSVFFIDSWNALGEQYVGINSVDDDESRSYKINFTPFNASVKSVKWISHNPDIAQFQTVYNNGIVPKKAGIARFTVISDDNPKLQQDLTIEFKYKNPLEDVSLDKDTYELKQYDKIDLQIKTIPQNATEQRFMWSYSKDGIVKVTDTIVREDTSNINNPIITKHTLSAIGVGTVTVTGTPIDKTNSVKPIKFTVTVTENKDNVDLDFNKYVTQNIKHSIDYQTENLKGNYIYGSEWGIFAVLRAGGKLDLVDLNTYYNDVVKELNSGNRLLPTDYFRIIATLTVMGKDPTNVEGMNLIEKLYNYPNLTRLTSNMIIFSLIGIDTKNYDIPKDALWDRDTLINEILSFQNKDNGGFGLSNDKSVSVDITAMALQALSPYNNKNYPKVQEAFSRALDYLRGEMLNDCGYFVEGGDNSCSTSQVLLAITSSGINPLDSNNGFTKGKNNIVSKLNEFKLENGFTTFYGNKTPDGMASAQIGYALESYRRFINGENRLYDLTDVKVFDQNDIDTQMANNTINLINQIGKVNKDSGSAIANARNAYNNLTENQKKLVYNYMVLVEAERVFQQLNKDENKLLIPVKNNSSNNDSYVSINDNSNLNTNESKTTSETPKTADSFKGILLVLLLCSSSIIGIAISKKRFKTR